MIHGLTSSILHQINFFWTEEWTTYQYQFVMTKETNDNGSILFEFGDIAGDRTQRQFI